MKESLPQAEVCLEETRAEAFSMLLHYLYTGRASLSSAREEVLLDFLGLAHRYGLQPLEDSTSEFLRTVLHTNNVCLVFDVASLYSLSALSTACCAYMDRHGPDVLGSDGFLTLSKVMAGCVCVWMSNVCQQAVSHMSHLFRCSLTGEGGVSRWVMSTIWTEEVMLCVAHRASLR